MPIEVITGLPGNAKTLYALQSLIERASREQRPVYYAGLKEFIADDPRLKGTTWIEFDPTTWHETVPAGSLIFIDECQKIFRARSISGQAPKYVTELEEHRHKGLDFVMVTQHPRLIDPSLRVLTQTHRHMVRLSGFEASTVHRWDSIKAEPDKNSQRTDSEKTKWAFAKDLYGLYKSADEHTIKARIPGRVKFLVVLLVLFVALVAYFGNFMKKKISGEPTTATAAASAAPGAIHQVTESGSVSSRPDPGYANPLDDARRFMWERTPRVEGLPETAPRYDSLTQATRVPIPAMCIQRGSVRDGSEVDCKCWTQQATPMDVDFNMCISIARNGRFLDFDPDPKKQQEQQAREQAIAQRSAQVMDRHPDVSMREPYGPPAVVAFDEVQSQLSEGMRPRPNLNTGPPNRVETRVAMARDSYK